MGVKAFPSANRLPSTSSAALALFGGFSGTIRLSDFPYPFIIVSRP